MAAGFFALLDDVASLLDDVAAMTKVATKKTAGVLGDDLALNANQLTGIQASRELPIIWAVSKGSLLNKAIIVPAAFILSAFLPAAVPLVLMIGGAYLCYEGVEKILHRLLHHGEEHATETADDRDPAQSEQEKNRAGNHRHRAGELRRQTAPDPNPRPDCRRADSHRGGVRRGRADCENGRPRSLLGGATKLPAANGGAGAAVVCAQTAESAVGSGHGGNVYRRRPSLG